MAAIMMSVTWLLVYGLLAWLNPQHRAPRATWIGFISATIPACALILFMQHSLGVYFDALWPIAATWQAFVLLGWAERWPGRIVAGIAAFIASLLVTAAYHWGYPEFQGIAVLWPMLGVGVMSLAYLFSRSPLAPTLSHVAMHITAVLYGLQTAIQLPPHY